MLSFRIKKTKITLLIGIAAAFHVFYSLNIVACQNLLSLASFYHRNENSSLGNEVTAQRYEDVSHPFMITLSVANQRNVISECVFTTDYHRITLARLRGGSIYSRSKQECFRTTERDEQEVKIQKHAKRKSRKEIEHPLRHEQFRLKFNRHLSNPFDPIVTDLLWLQRDQKGKNETESFLPSSNNCALVQFMIPRNKCMLTTINEWGKQITNSADDKQILVSDSERIHRISTSSSILTNLGECKRTGTVHYSKLGKWWCQHGKVLWEIPVIHHLKQDELNHNDDDHIKQACIKLSRRPYTRLQFSAELHLNKFGDQPILRKGVVTRDRFGSSFLPHNLFRPVVATFSAVGVGQDTLRLDYKHR